MWLYAVFCVCIPHIAKRLYSEVMLNINNECNGKNKKSMEKPPKLRRLTQYNL